MSPGRDLRTVLAVDDLHDYLELYEYQLGEDYDVRTAGDGDTALEIVSADVDVVLLDRDMPGTNGDDVLAGIRDAGYDCRVAMVTADEPDEDVFDLGYDAALTKPFSESELTAVVERLLRIADYVDAIGDFHEACERRAKRRTGHPGGNENAGIDDRITEHRERADEIAAEFDDEEYRVVFRDLGDTP
ncbi:response regulator [Halobacterium bonnevillei]|uniref:Response regulator n=1 Tax=Halobacterium bonnevillei TaxID=2692200 RepID=A0A6B0SFX1_9EURY|nr:response regulator [Halobacterium bonnevillei]MXR19887.1 response regulator [Halobacterium bonnevillei]